MSWDGDEDEVLGDDDITEDVDGPLTHLGDDDYDDFVRQNFGASGAPRPAPPVGRILLALILGLLILAVLALT